MSSFVCRPYESCGIRPVSLSLSWHLCLDLRWYSSCPLLKINSWPLVLKYQIDLRPREGCHIYYQPGDAAEQELAKNRLRGLETLLFVVIALHILNSSL